MQQDPDEPGARATRPTLPDDRAADRAEEVRAWFVQVRGGSPFLSGPDAHALCGWLDAGVPVVRILRAVEATAAHRRSKRLRAPFTLKSCARFLDAAAGSTPPLRRAPPEAAAPTPEPSGPALPGASSATRRHLAALYAQAAADVAAPVPALERIRRARVFHEAAWEALRDDHPALLAAAAEPLEDLRDLMDDEAFARVVEEAARHAVRAAFPALSVDALIAEGDDGLD